MNKNFSSPNSKKEINIWITYEGEQHLVKTYPNEYRNLMMLIYDKIFVEDFGDCLGMGRCGTCLIEMNQASAGLTSYDRNEQTTISKSGITDSKVRLSCQILIDQNLDGLKLTVLR